jgi:hypothetical protein
MDTVYKIQPKITQSEIPHPTGSVYITLSDGRSMRLMQTISGSGVRYANDDESFIFWVKGQDALVLEDNEEKNFHECTVNNLLDRNSSTTKKLHDTAWFSAILPDFATSKENLRPGAFLADETYTYNLSSSTTIPGTRYIIPKLFVQRTNLSQDSYLSVEKIIPGKSCNASLFLENSGNVSEEVHGGIRYSVGSSTGAAAGNRYEEIIYARPVANSCIGVRYFIHSTVLENYPKEMVKAFDRQSLLKTFDDIRNSITIK